MATKNGPICDEETRRRIAQIPRHKRWNEFKNVDFNIKVWNEFYTMFIFYPETKILDFGCGSMWSYYVLKHYGHEISGLDIDTPEVREHFSHWHRIFGCKVDYWDGVTMPYEDESFDIIISKASISKRVSTNWDTQLLELSRISKNGATWLVAPQYMYERLSSAISSEVSEILGQKEIFILPWDWDKTHPHNKGASVI